MMPEFAMEPWRLAVYMGVSFLAGSLVMAAALLGYEALKALYQPEKEPTSVAVEFPNICRSSNYCEWKIEG